jgi:hypothetical protein
MRKSTTLSITPRDVKILRGLLESRIMTRAHAAALYFDGKVEATKKRIQKLQSAGFIGERRGQWNERSILFLTKAGYRFLAINDHLENTASFRWSDKRMRVSDLTLRHELAVMDVRASLTPAIDRTGRFRVTEFCTWPELHAFKVLRPGRGDLVTVRPDGYLSVAEGDFEHSFFVEVDRSTESLDVLCQRALCYREFYASGGFAIRCGGRRDQFKKFPFRVLMIVKSEQRRDNMADRLLSLQSPILSQVWLTTLREVVAAPLAEIWIQPRDLYSVRGPHPKGLGVGSPFATQSKRSLLNEIVDDPAIASPNP